MTGLDTKVLVAWLLAAPGMSDVPFKGPYRVSHVVLAELVWVFDRIYNYSRGDIAALIEELLQTEGIDFTNEEIVIASLDAYRSGAADFADYLLMFDGQFSGCKTTLTFDKKAGRHAGFTLLKKEA